MIKGPVYGGQVTGPVGNRGRKCGAEEWNVICGVLYRLHRGTTSNSRGLANNNHVSLLSMVFFRRLQRISIVLSKMYGKKMASHQVYQ
jgi:hypothetical protein